MPKEERKKGTHLTWDDRHEIQKGLKEHRTFKEMKKALKSFDKNAMEKLGLEIIPPDEICLKPELLK